MHYIIPGWFTREVTHGRISKPPSFQNCWDVIHKPSWSNETTLDRFTFFSRKQESWEITTKGPAALWCPQWKRFHRKYAAIFWHERSLKGIFQAAAAFRFFNLSVFWWNKENRETWPAEFIQKKNANRRWCEEFSVEFWKAFERRF